MKKLVLTLLFVLALGVQIHSKNTNSNFNCGVEISEEKPERWIKLLAQVVGASIGVEIKFGQNKVINGQRFECIDGGTCSIKVNRMAPPRNLKDLDKNESYLIKDENGQLALIVPNSTAKARSEFDLKKGIFVSENGYTLNEILDLDDKMKIDFNKFELKPMRAYDLEQLENHVAILL